jgi:hypothetical protein
VFKFSWTVIDEGFPEPLSNGGVVVLRAFPTGMFISTHLQMRLHLSPKKDALVEESRRRDKGGPGLMSCGLSYAVQSVPSTVVVQVCKKQDLRPAAVPHGATGSSAFILLRMGRHSAWCSIKIECKSQ